MHEDRGLPASDADGVKAARRTIAEVRRILLADWDPIGVGDNPNLNDEYDDVLGHVMSALASGPSVAGMTATLQHMTEDLHGMIPEPASCHVAAVRLVALRQATPDWPTSSASIKQEVMAWVTAQLDTAPGKINPTSHLVEDLGLDGDEASDFIEAFGHEFDVDLSSLYSGWRRHFGPEGVPWLAGMAIAAFVAAPLLLIRAGVSRLWGYGCEIILLGLWFGPLRRWPFRADTTPITVLDLVRAAETKRWSGPIVFEPLPGG